MNRRGFLGSILAACAAPYVMSGGIGRGVLMPVRKLWVPADARIDLFDASGRLLATIGYPESKIDASGRLLATIGYPESKMDVMAHATVMNTGHVHYSKLEHPTFGNRLINLRFASHDLVTGSLINITPLQLLA